MKLYLLSTIIILFSSWSFYCQVNELPIHFGQFFNNPQINPAKGGSKGNVEVYNGNRRNQGNFGGIKTSYLSAYFRAGVNKGSFHSFGFSFNNDREGTNIARNRTYLSYARHQQLNKDWKLSAGLSGGMYNFSVKSNPVIGGASSGVLDVNLGLFLYSNKSALSFSINQLNGGEVQPFIQIIKLIPQYNFIAEHKTEAGDNLKITPSIFYRYANLGNKEINSRIGVSTNFLIANLINVGASYELKEGSYVFIGVHNISLSQGGAKFTSNNKFDVDFSYFMPSSTNTRTNINAFELTLKYFITK